MDSIVNEMPLISVNMPVYNGEKHLKQAIESILNQTVQDFELIIVNDGSTDNSLNILAGFNDARIKVFSNTENKGLAYTRNRLVALSKGKFIAILDSDDLAFPSRFEEQLAVFKSNPSVKLVGTGVQPIDENDKLIGKPWTGTLSAPKIKAELFFNNYFSQSSIMVERECFKSFIYEERFAPAEDYFIWTQIASKYETALIDKVLVNYRVHQNSISHVQKERQDNALKEIQKIQLKKLYPSATIEQLDFHVEVLQRKILPITSFFQLKKVLKWLKKLKDENNKSSLYETVYFNHKLRKIWDDYFDLQRDFKFGIKAIPFLFYGVNSNYSWKMKLLLILNTFKWKKKI